VFNVIEFDKGETIGRVCSLAGKLRRMGFDLTYSTAQINDLKAPVLSFLSGAKYRVGPRSFRLGSLYNIGMDVDENSHFVEREARLLRLIGVNVGDLRPRISLSDEKVNPKMIGITFTTSICLIHLKSVHLLLLQ